MTRDEFVKECILYNDDQIAIRDIFELTTGSFAVFMQNTDIGKIVRNKLSPVEYNRFVDGLFASLFGTLYASTLSEDQIEEFAKSMDGCLGFAIKEKRTDA